MAHRCSSGRTSTPADRRRRDRSSEISSERAGAAADGPIEAVRGKEALDRRRVAVRGRPYPGPATGGRDRGPGGRSLPGPGRARLGHELRTPLNAILGNTELLLDGSAGPLSLQARACLGDIQAAGQHLLLQVQVLLDLCYARARPALAGDASLDLIELLRAALAATPALARGRVLQVMPADACCILRGDATWLGVLAATLVELDPGDGRPDDPLLVTVERGAPPAGAAALRLWWRNFEPDQVSALPIALIDAILDLHGGAVALTGQGLQLDWPAACVVQIGPPAGGCGSDREGA